MKDMLLNLLKLALTPEGIASIVAAVGALLGLIAGTAEIRRRRIALAVNAAFHIAEDLAAAIDGEDDGFDKAAAALKAMDQYLVANGWRIAKPGEVVAAQLQFSALNGVQKVAEKVAVNSITASSKRESANDSPKL